MLHYEADPTGKRDATKAIQDAINDVYALGGGSVYIPAGKYLVSYPFIELKGFRTRVRRRPRYRDYRH